MEHPIVNRYKEILESGVYDHVAFRDIRGVVTDDQILFLDPDGEVVGIIDPTFDNLFGVINDRYYNTISDAVEELARYPEEFFS